MEPTTEVHALRLRRLREVCGEVDVELDAVELIDRTWAAVACSRLGNDAALHGEVCRFLARCMLDCRSRGAVLLVAEGSAVAPWAFRAAELFGVDVIRVIAGDKPSRNGGPSIACRGKREISRDSAVIALADRVDAAYVRPGGNIASCLKRRLKELQDPSTRVAVIMSRPSAARELIERGAIGWYLNRSSNAKVDEFCASGGLGDSPGMDPDWTQTDGEWLVHCTRTCLGSWPGETEHQYRDALLLGRQQPQRTPLESLKRILRTGRLVANATASARAWPVVCFSEAALRELLDQRCFRPHLKRWDYEPYGIAIRRHVAIELGIQPVIYGAADQRQQLDPRDQFRFQATGNTYDWRREREWRSPRDVDLQQLDSLAVRVFVPSAAEAQSLASQVDWPVDVVTLKPRT